MAASRPGGGGGWHAAAGRDGSMHRVLLFRATTGQHQDC